MSGFAVTASSHNHCTHCDGRATAREMAEAACKAGFSDFGFSCHSDLFCARLDEEAYIRDIRALAREYAGRLRIALGVEQDLYKPVARREAFDYVLGSVHYVKGPRTGRLYAVDAVIIYVLYPLAMTPVLNKLSAKKEDKHEAQ